jgi:hypothetical protein
MLHEPSTTKWMVGTMRLAYAIADAQSSPDPPPGTALPPLPLFMPPPIVPPPGLPNDAPPLPEAPEPDAPCPLSNKSLDPGFGFLFVLAELSSSPLLHAHASATSVASRAQRIE